MTQEHNYAQMITNCGLLWFITFFSRLSTAHSYRAARFFKLNSVSWAFWRHSDSYTKSSA